MTMRRASVLLLALLPLHAAAQDADRGRVLYQTYCGGCHYERIHDERLRPAVRDLEDLRDMVSQWAPQTKRSFTLDELADIVEYLNQSHYRFGLTPLQRKPPARRP
jgi:mono/diheme cytochrome c family protein